MVVANTTTKLAANCYIDGRLHQYILTFKLIIMEKISSTDSNNTSQLLADSTPDATEPQPSYVKLAMRNMVRKGGTSLKHFALTIVGLLAVLVGLAYLTR